MKWKVCSFKTVRRVFSETRLAPNKVFMLLKFGRGWGEGGDPREKEQEEQLGNVGMSLPLGTKLAWPMFHLVTSGHFLSV